MSCLGVHFAIIKEEVEKLKSIEDENDRLEYLQEEIEETYFKMRKEFLAESDKAWDAIHRILSDGKLSYDGGKYPLNHVILGGELLYSQDDYIMSLKTPDQVKKISSSLEKISKEYFRKRYFKIKPNDYGMKTSEDDFEYTWEWFQNVIELYKIAANDNRYVLFTADQ